MMSSTASHGQDGVYPRAVDAERRLSAHHGLGRERDADAGRGDHVEVVRAVAHRDRVAQVDSGGGRPLAQRDRLVRAVDDRSERAAREHAARDLEPVGPPQPDAEGVGQRAEDLGEAARDQPELPSAAPDLGEQLGRARREPDPAPDLVERAHGHAREGGHTIAQGGRKVDLAAHRALRHLRDLGPGAGVVGEELDHLVGDERGVDVGDDQAPAAVVVLDVRQRRCPSGPR
jgi:hypothetical protein